MASFRGQDGVIKFGGTPTVVAEVTSFKLDIATEPIEVKRKSSKWVDVKDGHSSWTVTLSANYDHGDTAQVTPLTSQLTDPQGVVAVELYPTGVGASNIKLSGNVVVENYNIDSPEGSSVAKVDMTLRGSGALTKATISS